MMTTAAAAATTSIMITTITIQQAVSLSIWATALLIVLLVIKELLAAYAAYAGKSWRARAAKFYAAALNVAIIPLLFIFALIVVTKVAALL